MRPHRMALMLLALSGCRAAGRPAGEQPDSSAPPLAELHIGAIGTGFEAPDSVSTGWYRVRLGRTSTGAGQNLVVFKVGDTLDLTGFANVLDTTLQTPSSAVARGGAEDPAPFDSSSVILHLEPGRYVLTSMARAGNRHRQVANGVWREMRVTPGPDSAAGPAPTIAMGLTDFAFRGTDTVPAGPHRIGVVNEGKQDHLFYLVRLRGAYSLTDWMQDGGAATSDRVGSVTRLGPGQSALLEVTLAPGRYVVTCLITDPATDKLHAELGMLRQITVIAATLQQ